MSQSALSRLWGFFAVSYLSLSFLFFLRTTGSGTESGAFGLLGYSADTVPAVGLPFDLVLAAITLWLTWVWSTQVGGPTWAHRLPIFYFEPKDVDPSTLGGKVYQGWAVALALVVPQVLLTQMAVRFFDGQVVRGQKKLEATLVEHWVEHFQAGRLIDEGQKGLLRFGAPGGPEYLWWTPWLYSALLSVEFLCWAVTLWSIFRTRKT
jgi:hypothetical protein